MGANILKDAGQHPKDHLPDQTFERCLFLAPNKRDKTPYTVQRRGQCRLTFYFQLDISILPYKVAY